MMAKALVQAHVFYAEMWEELAACIENIDLPFDLYVTTVGEQPELAAKVLKRFPAAKIIPCENKGFDVAPFLTMLDKVDLNGYDYIVKLHTKRDYPADADINGTDVSGAKWRDLLLSPFRTKENWARTKALLSDNQTGMVAEGTLILNKRRDGEKTTFKKALQALSSLNLRSTRPEFVAGTMFAVKAALFKCLQHQNVSFSENNRKDFAATPYVFERLFGLLVSAQGKEIKALNDDKDAVKRRWLKHKIRCFFFRTKTTAKGKRIVKICKIPVFMRNVK